VYKLALIAHNCMASGQMKPLVGRDMYV